MKIAVCSSMTFSKEMVEIKAILSSYGHEVILPHRTEDYANGTLEMETNKESAANKIKDDLFRYYFKLIKESDAILVLNYTKKNINNYVGANSLIEMAFAHVLDKKLYLLNSIPEMSCTDEIVGMQPIVLNGNLNLINNK